MTFSAEYHEGYEAYQQGLNEFSNPYGGVRYKHERKYADWGDGWRAAWLDDVDPEQPIENEIPRWEDF